MADRETPSVDEVLALLENDPGASVFVQDSESELDPELSDEDFTERLVRVRVFDLYTNARARTRTRAHTHARTQARRHAGTHTHTQTRTRTRAHTHTHAHAHAHKTESEHT